MNQQSLTIGRIFGIPIRIDYSWFLIFFLVIWTLASSYFPSEFKHWSKPVYWTVGAFTALLFFGSVLLHELAHSLVARQFKIPVRMVTLYIFGGISEMEQEPATAGAEFWITLSGPVTNLALGGLLAGLSAAAAGSAVEPLQAGLKYLAYINLLLGGFNLLPGFPLDGGKVLMAIVWKITHRRSWGILAAASCGFLIAYLFILAGALQIFNSNLMNGLWTAFLGWFLLNASGSAVRREKLQEFLSGHTVTEAMSRGYTIIYADTTLQSLVDEHILGNSRRSFLVKKDDKVVGLLTLHELQRAPKESWPTTTVEEVMIPAAEFKQIGPNTGIWEAINEMDRDGVNQLPVFSGGEILGMLTREDVISFIRGQQVVKKA
jgi:Zn-dependent protease